MLCWPLNQHRLTNPFTLTGQVNGLRAASQSRDLETAMILVLVATLEMIKFKSSSDAKSPSHAG